MGMQCRISQSISHCGDIGEGDELLCDANADGLGWSWGKKYLSDFDLLGVVIRACIEQAANVGKILLGGFVVAESATYSVEGFQLLEWGSLVLYRQIS